MTDLTERLRMRMASATALPWAINPPGMWWDHGQTYGVPAIGMHDARYYNSAPSKNDAEFIVDAVNALPDLLTTLETLTQENARLREAIKPFITAAEPIIHDDKEWWNPDKWFARLNRLTVGQFRALHAASQPAPARKALGAGDE